MAPWPGWPGRPGGSRGAGSEAGYPPKRVPARASGALVGAVPLLPSSESSPKPKPHSPAAMPAALEAYAGAGASDGGAQCAAGTGCCWTGRGGMLDADHEDGCACQLACGWFGGSPLLRPGGDAPFFSPVVAGVPMKRFHASCESPDCTGCSGCVPTPHADADVGRPGSTQWAATESTAVRQSARAHPRTCVCGHTSTP